MDLRESYRSLLAEYAAGSLDEAQALAVAAHLSLSEKARRMVLHYESVGGAMLARHCPPVAMQTGSFEKLMERIDRSDVKNDCGTNAFKACRGAEDLPGCLYAYIKAAAIEKIKPCQGRKCVVTKRLTLQCRKSDARLIRISPLSNIVMTTNSTQVLIVLEGMLCMGDDHVNRGDLIVLEEKTRTYLKTLDKGTLCLVAKPRGTVFERMFLRWIGPA